MRIICFSCANLHNAVIFNFPFTKGKNTIFLMFKNKILELFLREILFTVNFVVIEEKVLYLSQLL